MDYTELNKELIKIIKNENKKHPLVDPQIAQILSNKFGTKIPPHRISAIRADYIHQIPGAWKRKELYLKQKAAPNLNKSCAWHRMLLDAAAEPLSGINDQSGTNLPFGK